ncbi:lipoprotein [Paraoerskovia sediminicola]|uniref:Lipoprotein n=1 Tax=Paraoerskovia sediminicola TaxID=1138587 RepID=A0ABM8FZX1_9CELL|nr:extracellular solute-binding protein [Paraoerskovia sediminicola]BDZ41382.1 lipoprotein [Paraoerskovia sediminicola]
MRIARTKLATGLGTATVLALALTACSGSSDGAGSDDAAPVDTEEDITLTFAFWGNDDRADKYAQSIDLFEEANPNITVQEQFQSWPDYWTARNTEAAGSSLPDVMQMDLSYLRQYAAAGQLADLSGQIDTNLDVSGFDESLLASGTVDGTQYAIPTSVNTFAMFYNPALVESLGVDLPAEGYTWDDYFAWIEEASAAGADMDPQLYGAGDPTAVFWLFLQNLIQQGIDPFTEDGQLGFTPEDMTAWLDKGQPLRDAGATFPIDQVKQIEPLGGFTVNQSATEISWDNFLAGYVADSGTEDIAMLPIPAGDDGAKMFPKPSMLLAPSANSENPDAAAALISFLVNDPEVGTIFGTSKGVPAVQAQVDAMGVEDGSVDARVVEYEESIADLITETAPLPVEGFGAVEAEYLRLSEELQYGTITVDEFVEQWFASAEQSIPQS